ncbi:glutamate-rich protein 3 [Hippocampus comes]|uniref:glutamate-rich protein 3 n=1 Tax=Hippocampus comes TaxID=109280 RepID=UPI00094E86A2|nr:PREDICTED: glutamate-rich protein 3 [Hippocampus comes]
MSTMSHFNPGLISAYNSLTDKHLTGYFSSTRIRRHLQRAGLITRSGRIVPDKEYKHKLLQRAHQKHVRECLAQAIFLKVMEMERLHQMEIKRKLEEFARRERVHKMKVARTKRFEDDVRMMSPRPPVGEKAVRKQHSGPVGGHYGSSESPCSSRPNTAPGKMQRPARLKPIHGGNNKCGSPHRVNEAFGDNHPPFGCTTDRESRKHESIPWDPPPGISPYHLPVINNFVTPLPPATKKKARGPGCTPGGTPGLGARRRLRPAATIGAVDANEEQSLLRTSVPQSKARVTMVYFGKSVHLSNDAEDLRDEIQVFQQHCGGENLCVYKGKLREGEMFQFLSRRHRGFPFSLTFFLNGLQAERLSSCCEFKHRRGPRLGGRHGHFGFSTVERASPCYKCIIAMGLDRKPAPPPKKVQDAGGRLEEAGSTSHSGPESTSPQQDDKNRDDYDEDFEGDDNVAVEGSNEKKASPPTGGTDAQTKDETSVDSEGDHEEEDDTRPRSSSVSSEESHAEVVEDSTEDEEEAEEAKEILQEEIVEEDDHVNPEEAAVGVSSTNVDVSAASGKEQSREKTEGPEAEDESKSEEPARAKSVQEKLAEAIPKESQCSFEPELSETNTEEEKLPSADQGQELKKDEAVLVESQVDEASEPKEDAEAGREEPREDSDDLKDEMGDRVEATEQEAVKEAKDGGDSEEKMKEGDGTLESQDDASAISVEKKIADADSEVKPTGETTETRAEETAGGSEFEATPEDSSRLPEATVSKGDNVKDEGGRVQEDEDASADIQAASEGRDDPAVKSEERGHKEEEETKPREKPGEANEESERDRSQTEESPNMENTPEDPKDETQTNQGEAVATLDQDEPDESEKTETKNETAEAKKANEEKAGEVHETNADDGEIAIGKDEKETEESKDGTGEDDVVITAQREEDEEIKKAIVEESQAEESQAEESIVPESEETNQATTGNEEESKVTGKVENVAEEIEDWTTQDDKEKIVTSEVQEGEELDKATADNEEETEAATEDENKVEERKNVTDNDEEQKTVDAQIEEGDEISKSTTDDKKERAVTEKDDAGKDATDLTVRSYDGEEIKKATPDDVEESHARHKDGNEAERSHDVTGPDDDKEIVPAETETGGQINKSTVDNTEQSEREDPNKAQEGTNATVNPEGEKVVNSDTEERRVSPKDAQEAEKTSEEQSEDQKIVPTQNVGVFREANTTSATGETTADKVRIIEKGQRSQVDAENGETSTQEESGSPEDKRGGNLSEQSEKGREPDEESAERKLLDVKLEKNEKVPKVEGGSEIERNKNDSETGAPRVDAIRELVSDDSKRNIQDVEVEKETPKNKAGPSSVVGAALETFPKEKQSSKCPSQNELKLPGAEAGTEEAGKASEESASAIFQTRKQSNSQSVNQLPHGERPEALARASSAELVTNWLTTHQASKFFETFVEPLEDLRESDVGGAEETRQSSELLKIVETSPEEVAAMAAEVGHTKGEAQSYPERNPTKDDREVSDDDVEDDVKPLRLNTENETKLIAKDERKGSLAEDKAESTDGWRAASTPGIKNETAEQIVENVARLDVEPTATQGVNGSPENETHPALEKVEEPTSPDGKMHKEELTGLGHFQTSSSDIGSHVDVEDKASVNRRTRLTDDIVSQDRLSVWSLNKMPLGPSSYPLLASSRTESGH